MPPVPAPVLRFLAAVVVVVVLRWRTVLPLAERGAAVALLGDLLPDPTDVELGDGGWKIKFFSNYSNPHNKCQLNDVKLFTILNI